MYEGTTECDILLMGGIVRTFEAPADLTNHLG